MSDFVKPQEKTSMTDEERRRAAAKNASQNASGEPGGQVHARAPSPAAGSAERPNAAQPQERFEPAGRAVRATPPVQRDPNFQNRAAKDDEVDSSPRMEGQEDLADEDGDSNEKSSSDDEGTERKPKGRETASESEV